MKTITFALLGNPNTGKSSLFNALCGRNQQVANYPGVTVTETIGQTTHNDIQFVVSDLPGTYSLAPQSPDETVVLQALTKPADGRTLPEVLVCVLDASNLARNLYLLTQALDVGIPVVVALNMMDAAKENQIQIDVEQLEKRLGLTVIVTNARKKEGVTQLLDAVTDAQNPPQTTVLLGETLEEYQQQLTNEFPEIAVVAHKRMLLDYSTEVSGLFSHPDQKSYLTRCQELKQQLTLPISHEPVQRYEWIRKLVHDVCDQENSRPLMIDRVLTHPILGTLFFLVLILAMFQAIFTWAGPAMNIIDSGTTALGDWVGGFLSEGTLRSLIVDGIIAGVGAVVIFAPQIIILFLFISILEDIGYMARVSLLMDRIMRSVGLSGRSFIPLLSSFACAIPGVMATRTIANTKERIVTMLIAPLMSCSARLPVYILMTALFIPADSFVLGGVLSLQALVLLSMYLLGVVCAVLMAFLLRKTLLKGANSSFVMELPSFRLPHAAIVLKKAFRQGAEFVQGAGTIILASTILVWAIAYFPTHNDTAEQLGVDRGVLDARQTELQTTDEESLQEPTPSDIAQLEQEFEVRLQGARLRNSYLGKLGTVIEPVVKPLGWDWKIGACVIASFPAREVIVGTMGVVYNLGEDVDEESSGLLSALENAKWPESEKPVYTMPVALSIMVFFALCAQCVSTLAIIKKETDSWKWPIFTFVYMTGLAYLGALLTYQIGTILS